MNAFQELLDIIDASCADVDPSRDSCFILIILTHGCEGAVYAADGQKIQIEGELKSRMRKVLPGKPKMLIINACLGGM